MKYSAIKKLLACVMPLKIALIRHKFVSILAFMWSFDTKLCQKQTSFQKLTQTCVKNKIHFQL